MELLVQQGDLLQIPCDVLIVNLFEGMSELAGAAGALDRALGGWISTRLVQEKFQGKAQTTLEVPTYGKIPANLVLVVGLGKVENLTLEGVRQAAGCAFKRVKALKAQTVATLVHGVDNPALSAEGCAQAVTEGSLLANYAFDKYKTPTDDGEKTTIKSLLLIEQDAGKLPAMEKGATTGRIIADAVNMARDLTNEPPDLATPEFLAQSAQVLAAEYSFFCEVWDEGRIAAEKMNCLLMVARGSMNPPRFIRMDYSPQGTPKQHLCLIGKGLCYDSGGLSLKPAEHIRHMKSDMAGGAAVMAVMRIISQLHPDIAVTGLIPTCENMIGGSAYKVDDILRARNGKTIEIDNTDAEGRLVLADALSYAAEQHFDAVIDIATLTGGCVIALARVWTGVMGNNQQMIDELMSAGFAVGEKMWMLPFDKEVREQLDSDIADMKNADGREGSAIQGGMFLQEFAGEQPWVHLDIAGTSYLDKPRAYEPKGGTGVPTRALVEYILRL